MTEKTYMYVICTGDDVYVRSELDLSAELKSMHYAEEGIAALYVYETGVQATEIQRVELTSEHVYTDEEDYMHFLSRVMLRDVEITTIPWTIDGRS